MSDAATAWGWCETHEYEAPPGWTYCMRGPECGGKGRCRVVERKPDAARVPEPGINRPGVNAPDPHAAPVLRLTIDVPGFYVGGTEDAEDIEVAMQLSTEQVGLTFAHTEGDSPTLHLKTMEGRIVRYEVAS